MKKDLSKRFILIRISILFCILISIVPVFIARNNMNMLQFSNQLFSKLVFIGSVFIILMLMLPARMAWLLFVLFQVFVFPIELIHVIVFKEYITTQGMLALFNANQNESIGFISGREWLVGLIFIWLSFNFMILFILPKRYYLFKEKKKELSLFTVFIVVIAVALFYTQNSSKIKKMEGKKLLYFYKKNILNDYPLNVYVRFYEAWESLKDLSNYRSHTNQFCFGVTNSTKKVSNEVYVLVIGESARYENYQFNGYKRKTTPRLSTLKNLIPFSNFYSTANSTINAIPLMITRGEPNNFKRCYEDKSIISLFKEGGFETYWISNQDIFSNNCAGLYKNETDHFQLFNNSYDEIVIEELDKDLKREEGKKMIIINLLGNHFGTKIYPPEFNNYTPNSEDSKVINNKSYRWVYINNYDNSVLYQDYVLHQIILKLKSINNPSFLFFSSDHGESLYDAPLFILGHGSLQLPKEQYHVSAFVWYSDQFKNNNQDLVRNIQKHKNSKLNATNTFYSFADIASV